MTYSSSKTGEFPIVLSGILFEAAGNKQQPLISGLIIDVFFEISFFKSGCSLFNQRVNNPDVSQNEKNNPDFSEEIHSHPDPGRGISEPGLTDMRSVSSNGKIMMDCVEV